VIMNKLQMMAIYYLNFGDKMDEKEFYTVMEFSNKLRIHPNTVRTAIKQGRIQAFRVGIGSRSDYRIPNTEINRISEMDMLSLIKKIVENELEKKNV
jgi:excisionase family DNA binding protein